MGLFLRLGRAGCDPASRRNVFIVFSCSGKAEHFHFAACKVLLLSCSVKDEPSSSRRSWEFDRWTFLFFFISDLVSLRINRAGVLVRRRAEGFRR